MPTLWYILYLPFNSLMVGTKVKELFTSLFCFSLKGFVKGKHFLFFHSFLDRWWNLCFVKWFNSSGRPQCSSGILHFFQPTLPGSHCGIQPCSSPAFSKYGNSQYVNIEPSKAWNIAYYWPYGRKDTARSCWLSHRRTYYGHLTPCYNMVFRK